MIHSERAQSAIECRPLRQWEVEEYLAFARRRWGARSHQASPGRLSWLYEHNPNTAGLESDLIVAKAGNAVVGSHHRMRIPWSVDGERIVFPSVHDLAADEDHRPAAGVALIMTALAGQPFVMVAGLSAVSERVYAAMKCAPVPVRWQRRVFSPVRAALHVLGRRSGLRRPLRLPDSTIRVGPIWAQSHSNPTDAALDLALGIVRSQGGLDAAWDRASFRWRFFDPAGPRCVLVLASTQDGVAGRLVYSLGLRGALIVARIVDAAVADERIWGPLLEAAERFMRASGAAFASSATSCDVATTVLAERGWVTPRPAPTARLYARHRRSFEYPNLWGGAWDFGTEEPP